jgi:outer membrane protein
VPEREVGSDIKTTLEPIGGRYVSIIVGAILIFLVVSVPCPSFAVNSFTLDQAIKIALQRNPIISKSHNELLASKEARRGAIGRLLPQINGYAGYTRLSDPVAVVPIKSFGGAPPTFSRDQYKVGITVKIPIYEGGRLWTQVSMAKFSKAISEANLRFTKQDIIANVTNVFNRILYIKSLIKAREETLSALEKAERDAEIRLKVGRIAPVDLMRIETQVAQQRQYLIESREEERRSRQTLALLLGIDPFSEPDTIGTLSPPNTSAVLGTEARLEEAIKNRPDVQKALREVRRAEANVSYVKGLHFPSVDLVGDYGRRAGSGFVGDEEVWSGGITVNLNIFSGGVISAQVREAEARLLAAKENLREAKLNARAEVLHAISLVREAKHRFCVARAVTSTARETFRIEDLKYRTGAGTITDSLLAQSAWLTARASELSAMYDMQKAVVDYRLAMGTIDR